MRRNDTSRINTIQSLIDIDINNNTRNVENINKYNIALMNIDYRKSSLT